MDVYFDDFVDDFFPSIFIHMCRSAGCGIFTGVPKFQKEQKTPCFCHSSWHNRGYCTSHWLAGCGRTGRALYMLPSDRPTMTMPLPSIMGALQCAWAVGLWTGWQTTSACMKSLQTNNFAGACEKMYIVCTWYIHILMCHIRTNKTHTRSGHAHTHMHMQACECLHIYIKNRL